MPPPVYLRNNQRNLSYNSDRCMPWYCLEMYIPLPVKMGWWMCGKSNVMYICNCKVLALAVFPILRPKLF